jgi:lipoyl-dependent peroxiredoxin
MPRVERSAEVRWQGNVARGDGRMTVGSGAFAGLPFSLPTRIGEADGKTSPEELLAAAHAGCYAMSLAGELAGAGTPADDLRIRATVILDELEGGSHRIVASRLHARARVQKLDSKLDSPQFEELARAADEGCPFSALIKAAGTVTVNAELEGGTDGD